ncbi:MAG TPA: T9SS type A sorting domain-containing protein, partial [Bacteroidia bacterium]|nr:T9SS type A sorting domain-containing protein [Bacteroidia bacterium]
SLNISAVANGDAVVPTGYQTIYVLTSGAGLVIEQVNATPDFTVASPGLYTIHTLVYDPNTLDLSIVVPGVTTGFDVNGLLVQGGGSICASLDVAGAQFNVTNPSAGTLTANTTDCSLNISAVANGDAVVPAGYQTIYVLTSGTGLVIEQVNATPDFTVASPGLYAIHTLVYDPNTLDLSIVVPGVTTGFDVNGLLVQGGGSICASLDVAGAPFNVAQPDAGDINPDDFIVCLNHGTAVVNGIPAGNEVVPSGYQVLYVLTRGLNLVIQQVSATPSFTVSQIGLYRIHTLVYDPNTLNLSIVVPGVTTGFDVNGLLVQGGGSVCAALDVQGAPFIVLGPIICSIFNLDAQIAENQSENTIEQLKQIAQSGNDYMFAVLNTYPNPASDILNLDIIAAPQESLTVTVSNVMGQNLKTIQIASSPEGITRHSLDVSDLASGTYILQIRSGSQTDTKRFVIN